MSAAPSPARHPFALFQKVWFTGPYVAACASYLAFLWFVLGPANPLYALSVVGVTWSLTPAAFVVGLERRVPRHWFRVAACERILLRLLGVGLFGWLLDLSGWNRLVVRPMRGFTGRRTALLVLEESVRATAAAHGMCFAIHVLLAFLALFTAHPWRGALWMLLPGVVPHLYPLLVQRAVLLRLQPLLDRKG